jgi:hypothetical protein
MMNVSTLHSAVTPSVATSETVDLVDLLYELAHIRKPDRFVDRLVELLVHRRRFDDVLTTSKVRFANWLESEIPTFTQGGSALNVLAAKLGYRVSVSQSGDRYAAVASDVRSRRRVEVQGYLAGAAGILALIRLALEEKRSQ